MNNQSINPRNFETIAWGAFFMWWGITELLKPLPEGTGAIGIGLILLALNLARFLSHTPISGFTTTLAVIAIGAGGWELARPALHLSFELPLFAILLIACGAIVLLRALGRAFNMNTGAE
jgi:hypothetical protein